MHIQMIKLAPKNYFALIPVFALAAGLFPALPVYADADDLVVDFESSPLFSDANFLPGGEVTRSVDVTNNTDGAKNIIVEAINVSDPNEFGDVLNLRIKEDGDELFNDSLSEFFDAGEISLSEVTGGGGETTYDFTVSFSEGTENSYQGKSIGFDILIGFKGAGGGNDEGGDGEGGGGGGGGGGGIAGLVINNERSVSVDETTATINWLTSFFSTSRVIYDTIPGTFNFSAPPNYGYAFSTPESDTPANPNGVTFHTVVISGLTPGTTYYYRTVSHASPDTVSFEQSFMTKGTKPPSLALETSTIPLLDGTISTGASTINVSGIERKDEGAEAQEIDSSTSEEEGSVTASLFEQGGTNVSRETNVNAAATEPAAVILGINIGQWMLMLIGVAVLLVIAITFRSYRRRTLS